LTDFEDQICLAESQAHRIGISTRTSSYSQVSSDSPIVCGYCGKNGHTKSDCYRNPRNQQRSSNSRHQAHQAYAAQPGRGGGGRAPSDSGRGGRGGRGGNRRPVQCFKCGATHSLSVCHPEERERLYREKLGSKIPPNAHQCLFFSSVLNAIRLW
jgi:hypothetical protein